MSELDGLEQMFGDGETTPVAPESSKPEPQATPEVKPASEPDAKAPEQPRDDSGRFAPKETQPATAAPAPVTTIPQPAQTKPLIDAEQFKGYIEEREKRQKLEAEVKALRERVEQQAAQPIPNVLDDPEGHAAYLSDQVQRTAISTRFDTSELIARQAHGDDAVQKAMDWGMEKSNASKAFATEYVSQRHPIDWIVKAYKRDQLVSSIGDDADAWALKRAAELAAATAQQPPQAQQPAPPIASPTPQQQQPPPTRSLASAQGAGSIASVPMGEFAALDAMFTR